MVYLFQQIERMVGMTFFGPYEVESCSGYTYTNAQIDDLVRTLPGDSLARLICSNHCILVPTPPVPVNFCDLCDEFKEQIETEKSGSWYCDAYQTFSHNEYLPVAEWVAVRNIAWPESRKRPWVEQNFMIPSGMYQPNAVLSLYAKLMNGFFHSEFRPTGYTTRTSSFDANWNRVIIGPIENGKICIKKGNDREASPSLMSDIAMILE